MGVRGLTTYINNNSNKFFEGIKLHNTKILIDGNCLATILFYNSITNTASFGGDYDRYAKGIETFFNELLKCNINPIVIFDGGYEKKKLRTVYTRNKNKMLSLKNIGPTDHSKVCFPLMMRQVFRDKLKEMGITFAQSDFEADQEIAALARKLQCPVLSNDSDFFIYDVTLIPINEFSLEADIDSGGQHYMSCMVYKVEHFLHSLGGLPKSHLPLLAALLGNDYISTSTFGNFYSQMKITRGRKQAQIHYRVQAIISWLKKESFESALKKILCHLKKNKQKQIATKVAKIIQDYSQVSTPLEAYLVKEKQDYSDFEIMNVEDILKQYDNIDETLEVSEEQSDSNTSDSQSDVDNNEEKSDEDELDGLNNAESTGNNDHVFSRNNQTSDPLDFKELPCNAKHIPPWLIDYSREGNLPSCIITLFSLKIYFCVPQVEDYDMSHAGMIGLPILSKIAGILLGENSYSYYCRAYKCKYICNKISTITNCGKKKIPLLSSLYLLNLSQRKSLFLDIFEISPDLLDVVNCFPENWHLFIFSLAFWSRNIKEMNFQSYYFHAVTFMIICVRVIDSKIGYFRNKRPFMQRYSSKIKKSDTANRATSFDECQQINDIIESIPLEECLTAFEIFLPYFQIEEKLKTNAKFFSRSTIHAFAQFQVCIDMAYTLNSLLRTPFEGLPIHNFFNATFLYNFCANFKKRTNVTAYVETLLVRCPTILNLHKKIVELFSNFVVIPEKPQSLKKRRKRKKIVKKSDSILNESDKEEDASSYSDEDNTFSLLAKLSIK